MLALIQPSDFGVLLKEKRKEANLTQDELASAIQKTGQYISNIEKGKNCAPPNDSDIEALINKLELDKDTSRLFREKAAADRMRLPKDQMNYLFEHEHLLKLIYYGQKKNMDDKSWEQILKTILGGKYNDT